jgi:hypothetical protein
MIRLVALTLLILPLPALAEVMDKEPSVAALLTFGVCGGIASGLAARFRPRVLWVLAPIVLFYFAVQLSELSDPVVGPAILREAGPSYVWASWASLVIPFAGLLIGAVLRRKRRGVA